MSNNMKFLLLNITLLAGMYCNCEYSRCAGCCKNCCWNEEEGNNNKNENIYKKNKGSQDATTTYNIIKPGNVLNQQGNLSNNNANGKNDNKENSVKNVEENNKNENNNNEEIEGNNNKNEDNILVNNNNQLHQRDNVSSNQENLSDNNDNDTNNNGGNNVGNGEVGNNNEDNKNENNILDNNNIQLPLQNDIKDEITQNNKFEQSGNLSDNNSNGTDDNKGNSGKNGEEGSNNKNNNNEEPEERKIEINGINDEINEEEAQDKKDLYFKIEGGAIDNNDLKCFGKGWFEEYKKKKDNNNENTILLYKLTEQQDVKGEEVGTLVYSKENKKLEYRNGVDFQNDLKDSKNKWAIFKVTTLNNEEKEGEGHIFYCSDVSTLNGRGLFEDIKCWSIEILAAKTTEVKTFDSVFSQTNSLLEQDTKKQNKSGFIGLEKLDVSGAEKLTLMFYMALFKQKTINSLSKWRLRNNADISWMFFVNTDKVVDKDVPDFSALWEWIVEDNVYLVCFNGSKYNTFFQGYYNSEHSGKLPEWYESNFNEKS
ncbi:MAG: hypothetical protein II393_03465 [Cytophagales bacterium]|nr:hypothetical protein [Cytophagales bacterium]